MRCTKPVGDQANGWEACNEDVADELEYTCYDHTKLCLIFACKGFREWDQTFCQEHMRHREP